VPKLVGAAGPPNPGDLFAGSPDGGDGAALDDRPEQQGRRLVVTIAARFRSTASGSAVA